MFLKNPPSSFREGSLFRPKISRISLNNDVKKSLTKIKASLHIFPNSSICFRHPSITPTPSLAFWLLVPPNSSIRRPNASAMIWAFVVKTEILPSRKNAAMSPRKLINLDAGSMNGLITVSKLSMECVIF